MGADCVRYRPRMYPLMDPPPEPTSFPNNQKITRHSYRKSLHTSTSVQSFRSKHMCVDCKMQR